MLAAGRAPVHEPGLVELLGRGLSSRRLSFTTEFAAAAGATVHFVAVDTPQGEDGAADLSHLRSAFEQLLPQLSAGSVVVGKSTVPVGTAVGFAEAVESA